MLRLYIFAKNFNMQHINQNLEVEIKIHISKWEQSGKSKKEMNTSP
jgi:hypothetical protein